MKGKSRLQRGEKPSYREQACACTGKEIIKGEEGVKDAGKEACLGGTSCEHQQNGGCSRPNFIPSYVLLAVRLLAFLRVPLCPPAPGCGRSLAAVASPTPGCSILGERICRKLLCSCCRAALILLIMKIRQEFIILL